MVTLGHELIRLEGVSLAAAQDRWTAA